MNLVLNISNVICNGCPTWPFLCWQAAAELFRDLQPTAEPGVVLRCREKVKKTKKEVVTAFAINPQTTSSMGNMFQVSRQLHHKHPFIGAKSSSCQLLYEKSLRESLA